MTQLFDYVTEHWIIGLVAAIVIIFVIGALIKAAVKVALVALVIGVILVYFLGFSPAEIFEKGKTAAESAVELYQDSIEPMLTKEIENADYKAKPNGDYEITTDHVTITGNKDEDVITLSYNGHSYELSLSELGDSIQQKISDLEAQAQ